MEIKIEYTKSGLKLTHPSRVVQVLSIEDLTKAKNSQEQRKTEINNDIARINAHMAKTSSAREIK